MNSRLNFKNESVVKKISNLSETKDDLQRLYKKAKDLCRCGKFSQAIFYLDKVINADPCNSDAILQKGIALYKLDSYRAAICCFDVVLQKEPQNSDALYFEA